MTLAAQPGTGFFEKKPRPAPTAAQLASWGYYGMDFPGQHPSDRRTTCYSAVGEVRYVVGWAADQMSRMRWLVLIDGEREWTLTLPDGSTVTATTEPDSEQVESHARASASVLDLIGWGPTTVRQVTTNLYVAGELDYIALGDSWHVVSVVHGNRNELIETATHVVRGIWPHPANPTYPDAPLFGVLAVLEEMDWLSRLSRAQSANRVGIRGILGSADGLSFANGGDFWTEFDKAIGAKMSDPTNVAPLHLRGAQELIEPAGNGMKGLSWVIPSFPYDERIEERMQVLIQRLAYGLPIPPEILTGLQSQSRATAFQVEENSYRAHIEPPAQIVATLATATLQLLLPDQRVEVVPDPSLLLARRHTTQDVKDAFDRGGVSFPYLREVLGIPETAAATEEDIELIVRVKDANAGQPPGESRDAGERSARGGQPGVTSAAGPPSPPDSSALGQLDLVLMAELAGATVQAVDRARERVGAKARTYPGLRSAVPADVPNSRVASHLTSQVIQDSGVPISDIVTDAVQPLSRWWASRAAQAQGQLADLLPEYVPSTDHVRLSVDLLADLVSSHVIDTLDSESVSPLSTANRVQVLSALGGDSPGVRNSDLLGVS